MGYCIPTVPRLAAPRHLLPRPPHAGGEPVVLPRLAPVLGAVQVLVFDNTQLEVVIVPIGPPYINGSKLNFCDGFITERKPLLAEQILSSIQLIPLMVVDSP